MSSPGGQAHCHRGINDLNALLARKKAFGKTTGSTTKHEAQLKTLEWTSGVVGVVHFEDGSDL